MILPEGYRKEITFTNAVNVRTSASEYFCVYRMRLDRYFQFNLYDKNNVCIGVVDVEKAKYMDVFIPCTLWIKAKTRIAEGGKLTDHFYGLIKEVDMDKYQKIIKVIDNCIDDYSSINLLCCCYEKFASANKADKEFKYKTVNEFGKIAVICNLGLEEFKVQTDVEFCKKLQEDLNSYAECGGDLGLVIDSFNELTANK